MSKWKAREFEGDRSTLDQGYEVQRGDTLWSIAEKSGMSVEELMKINGITDPRKMKAGMRLYTTTGPNKDSMMYGKPAKQQQQVPAFLGPQNEPGLEEPFIDPTTLALGGLGSIYSLYGNMGKKVGQAALRKTMTNPSRGDDMAGAFGRLNEYKPMHYSRDIPSTPLVNPRTSPNLINRPELHSGVPRYGGMSRRPPDISQVRPTNYMGQERTLYDLEAMLYGGGR